MLLNEALRWLDLGVSCVPVQAKNKHIDNIALQARGYKFSDLVSTLPTKDDLRFWFAAGRRKLAIVTGRVICVDFDKMGVYWPFVARYPALNYTFTVKSPNGIHLYYWVNKPAGKLIKPVSGLCLKHKAQPIITAGKGYEILPNGLLSEYTMLRLESIFTLPFVEEKEPEKEPEKPPIFRRCQYSGANPIKTIKENLPISQYLADLGHELKPLPDRRYITNCPLHPDKNPSFWIDEKTKNCSCYACRSEKKSMDILDLHQKINQCSLRHAISELATSLGF